MARSQILLYLCPVLRTWEECLSWFLQYKDNKLLSICRDFKSLDDFVVKSCTFCKTNIDFWLQYAIARLYNRDYVISKTLFDKCYSLSNANYNYKTYKIDNHYCRFLLENEIENGSGSTCMDAFRHAHEILSNTRPGDEKKHYPFKVASLYQKFYDTFKNELSEKECKEFKQSCLNMLEKCQNYLNSNDCTNARIVRDTQSKLTIIIAD